MLTRLKFLIKNIADTLLFKGQVNASRIYTPASDILEISYGHFNSLQSQRCIDSESQPIPWFTYPAIEYLKQLDLSGKKVLEWGAGYSSRFFAARCANIISIESNPDWIKELIPHKLGNQTILLAISKEEYLGLALKQQKKFDVIIVDDQWRDECLTVAMELLKEGGLIILDNSDRHPAICEKLRGRYIQVDMHGFGPINPYTWTTTLFFCRKFDFKPLDAQPYIPIGGGY